MNRTIQPKDALLAKPEPSPSPPLDGVPHQAPLGLRWVAIFELIKGFLLLIVGLGALSLVGRDVVDGVEALMRHLHLDPAWHYCKLIIGASSTVTDTRLRIIASIALIVSGIRFLEGYGLWHEKPWAEWFAVITAAVYLPLEIHHFWVKPSIAGVVVFIINAVIVVYLARLLSHNCSKRGDTDRGS